jgi:hypothetical protein
MIYYDIIINSLIVICFIIALLMLLSFAMLVVNSIAPSVKINKEAVSNVLRTGVALLLLFGFALCLTVCMFSYTRFMSGC